jgi:hypothetical protein
MFRNTNVPKNNNNNIKIKNIIKNNKKMDYDTIKSLVDDNAPNIRTSQLHMSNKRQQKLK